MMADSLTEHTSEAIGNLRDRFSAAQERFTDMYDSTKKKVVAGAKCYGHAIRENPYQSLALALGVGFSLACWSAGAGSRPAVAAGRRRRSADAGADSRILAF